MKKIIVVCLSFVFCNMSVFAQESALQGFYLQGDVGFNGLHEVTTGVSGKYWSEYLGGQIGLGYSNLKSDSEGTDIYDESNFSISAAVLGAVPMDHIKPYVSVGIVYTSYNDDLNDLKLNSTELVPAIGLDVAITDNLLFGVTFASLNLVLSATAEISGLEADVDGSSLSLLNGFHVGYKF